VSYRAGTFGIPGIADDSPRIICDGCSLVFRLPADRLPPMWFLDGKTKPGWKKTTASDGQRRDYCPQCKARN